MTLSSGRRGHDRRRCIRRPLASVGAALAVLSIMTARPSAAAETAAREASIVMAVAVTKAKKACIPETLVVVGTVVPRREVLIRPDREGLQIKEILVAPGDTVSAAQVLARLAPATDQQQSSIVAVRASVGGVVVAAPSVIGEMASARGEPLFRIVAEGELDLQADVPANRASRLSADQPAKIKIFGMDEMLGRVRLVSTTIDAATQLGQIRISLERNPSVRIGVFARATIEMDNRCGPTVPLSALLFDPEGPVLQLIRDNRIETRRVAVGVSAKNNVQICDGVTEGDLIVVRAGAFLREGDRVQPVVEGGD